MGGGQGYGSVRERLLKHEDLSLNLQQTNRNLGVDIHTCSSSISGYIEANSGSSSVTVNLAKKANFCFSERTCSREQGGTKYRMAPGVLLWPLQGAYTNTVTQIQYI